MEKFDSNDIWASPKAYKEHLLKKTNFFESFFLLKNIFIKKNPSRILDLGCGFGWTTVLVHHWCKNSIVMGCDPNLKLEDQIESSTIWYENEPIDCSRLKFANNSFENFNTKFTNNDIILYSAAIHHAVDLEGVIKTSFTALKKGGFLIIANETTLSRSLFHFYLFKKIIKIVAANLTGRYSRNEQLVSQGRIRYDSRLGDWFIDLRYLKHLCSNSGFELVDDINTKLYPYKGKHHGNIGRIKHFIFRKN